MLSAEDLLEPKGAVNPSALFPGESATKVEARLEAYLADGYSQASDLAAGSEQDEAARQWAYYRARDARYQVMVAKASTVDVAGEGSKSYLVTQITLMGELRDQALAAFKAILDAAVEVEPEVPAMRSSYSAPIQFRF